MALQLQRCGAWSHDALPWRRANEPSHKTRRKAQTSNDSLRLSFADSNESALERNSKLAPAADRWNGISSRDFVAEPRYSSLLKLTRRRRHEVRMQTRDRVYLSISEWVFRRVNDPLVEIDPVTVNEAILAEQEAGEIDEGSASSVPTTTSPSFFGYLPPGFPKGADKAALAAAIVLLLAALATWAILALRGKKDSGAVPAMASGQDGNGSVTNGGARQEVEGERTAGWQEPSVSERALRKPLVPVLTPSFESQATAIMPIPQYSTALAPSDLPLPPSFGANARDQKINSRPSGEVGSGPDDELVVPSVTLPSESEADKVDAQADPIDPPVESHEMAAIDEEIISSGNGEVQGHSPTEEAVSMLEPAPAVEEVQGQSPSEEAVSKLEPTTANEEVQGQSPTEEAVSKLEPTAAIEEVQGQSPSEEAVSKLESAVAIEEVAATSALLEELATVSSGSELGPKSISEPLVSGLLPPASESLEQQISVNSEYILVGESDSLSPVGAGPSSAEPIAELPAKADVGVPVDSVLVDNFAASQHPSDSEKIDGISTSIQEEVPAAAVSTPSKEFQVDSDAGVVEERRKEYAQALEKVLPAVSVGAGVAALSSFSGVDGAFQVVGVLAAASFLKEYIWANPRQQLLDEIRNIKSHQELMQFLKDKDIFPQSWSH